MPNRRVYVFLAGALVPFLTTGAAFAEDEQQAVGVPAASAPVAESAEPILDDTALALRGYVTDPDRSGTSPDRRDAIAVSEFYAGRTFAPAWFDNRGMTSQARALIERLKAADTDGLDPTGFALPDPDLGGHGKPSPQVVAKADVTLSLAIAAYARLAYGGQVDPAAISKNIGYQRQLPDLTAALQAVSASADPAKTLASYNPPHREFAALRQKLADLRSAEATKKPIEIPSGKTLKHGAKDARVGFLRQRLGLPSDVASPALYDESVVEAVKAFQRSAGLKADGIVGRRTIAALNADPVDPVPAILVNMEKWRWMARDLGRFYVRVNVPDFTVDVFDNGESIHKTRIVVGKPSQQTPIFSDEIEHAIVNPAWNVPASIARNELLPAARRNPRVLRGYEVFALSRGRYRQIDPRRLRWRGIDARKVQIRQPPGPRNALGKVKFMFPNRYSVYLHDTPAKSLFQRDYRAFSHGCMRVMNPMEFADALLSNEEFGSDYLESLYGRSERRVDLKRKVPVHVTYFTAWVDESGSLQVRNDLYGHDRRIEQQLGPAGPS